VAYPAIHCSAWLGADAPEAFCDVWAFIPTHLFRESGVQVTFKLLSVDPANYDDAPSEGIRRLLQIATRQHIPKGRVYDTSIIGE
jgi:5-oxoprolinase (ATP-hydrolysing)